MDTETQLAFEGTKEERELAARAFELMKRQGMMFAANAPIKMTVEGIANALTKGGAPMLGKDAGKLAPKIEAALRKNPSVFVPGDNGEFVTTKSGHAPQISNSTNTHTFKERLNTEVTALDAEAAKEYASSLMSRAAERTAFVDNLIEIPVTPPPIPIRPPQHTSNYENSTLIPQHLIPRPPVEEEEEEDIEIEAPAPQHPQEAAVVAPPVPVPQPVAPKPTEQELPPARRATPPAPTLPQPSIAQAPARPAPAPEAPAPAAKAASTPAQALAPAAPPKPAPAPAPAAPVITGPVEVRIPTAGGPVTVDLRDSVDDIMANEAVAMALEAMVASAVASDSRLVFFGSDIFPDEAVERFSKGDFRRIKEYLDEPETGGVASDRDIMADVLNRRPEHPDYERLRFSLDYRMLKEKKDFEFVGIDSDRLWISAGASPVVPPARKPAEIGQDYRFLEDPAMSWAEEEDDEQNQESGSLDYALTYYEYENGMLPYDRRAKRMFQGSVFEDQRASLLRFEIPQLYGSLLAELRYPAGNRGGYVMGLGELFTEHMVPGAKFTVVPTDRGEDVFEIAFTRTDEREENLLQFDERKGRYVFRPVSFTVETDPPMLLTQDKFGKLQNRKKLDESERKRPDVVIINAFEVVGEQNDGKLWAIFDDLYPVVNLERPISRSWLRTMLSGAYPFFYADESTPGAYFYDASKRP